MNNLKDDPTIPSTHVMSAAYSLHSSMHPRHALHDRLRVVLVDDEALARRAMNRILNLMPEVEVVAECSNGAEAIHVIKDIQPDVVFLDVEMPGTTGLDVVREIRDFVKSHLIFVTAHERYAIEAFKVHAMDYVVKPICEERIHEVLQRVMDQRNHVQFSDLDSRLNSILHLMEQQKKDLKQGTALERMSIRNNGRIYFIETSSIDWIQAEGNYATLHTGTTKHLLRIKMNHLEEKLDPKTFFRVHRSTIINIHSIKELRPYFNGAYMIILSNGMKLFSSRGYRESVEQILSEIL
jgi:two-component system, LytTR family, response regulator